ncbi:MAG: hypothetical protein O9274_04295 [Limnobacter sp.]|uniref:hypothetical protein n=1 Tax=Limnobacter sp. TaxID=2003368 RepID=UPI0022C05191|nr:hypothetical protein [Limnobacter sp.]MCZ8014899.1 hypothetical protein [Limnobacter sp.]
MDIITSASPSTLADDSLPQERINRHMPLRRQCQPVAIVAHSRKITIKVGVCPVSSDIPVACHSRKPARLNSHATFGCKPATHSTVFFVECVESV